MNMKFILEYIKHPRTTGAIAPSSKRLAGKMMKGIDFESAECIVEYGPGTGIFTSEIIKRRNENTKIILIEYNKDFYDLINEKYGKLKNVFVVNDSAENIEYYIDIYNIKNVNYIVSGLPFASLPEDMSRRILEETKKVLKGHGTFITFQYTKLKVGFINNYFKNIGLKKEFINVPPAYVLSCNNTL